MVIGYPDWGTDTAVYEWVTQGEQNNPIAGIPMAKTSALSAGYYDVVFILSPGTVAMTYLLQHLLSGNGSTVRQQLVRIPASGSISIEIPGLYRVAAGEKFRIMTYTAGTGICQCSILYRRVG